MTHWKAINIALTIYDTCKEYTDECTCCPFNMDGCIVSDDGEIEIPERWKVGELRDRMIEIIRRKVEE